MVKRLGAFRCLSMDCLFLLALMSSRQRPTEHLLKGGSFEVSSDSVIFWTVLVRVGYTTSVDNVIHTTSCPWTCRASVRFSLEFVTTCTVVTKWPREAEWTIWCHNAGLAGWVWMKIL